MTELRDARLRQAMEQAPDVGAVPSAQTRQAIRAAAHSAVQPRWRRWFAAGEGHRTPWTAAFATVLLASFITALWQGREIPGVEGERVAPKVVATAPAPAPAPAAVPTPSPPEAAAPERAPRSEPVQPPPARAAKPSRSQEPSTPLVRGGDAETRPVPSVAAVAPPPAPPAVGADSVTPMQQAAPAPAPAAAPAPLEKSNSASMAEGAPLRDSAVLARRPAPAPPPPAAVAAPHAAAAALGSQWQPVPRNWSQVRIEAGADSIVLERAQAAELARLLEALLRSAPEPLAPSAPVSLRFELGQGAEAIGVLELAGERWRWLPLRNLQQARSLAVDPAADAALRAEARRVLGR